MYLIAIPVSSEFDAAKALAKAFEHGILSEPSKAWNIVGSALYACDARIMAQAIANDRQVPVEIRSCFISSGNHYSYGEVKPEPKPADEPIIEWEPYDGVPADTIDNPPVNLAADTF